MVCYLCNGEKQNFGFQIKNAYVCDACEKKIVELDVYDANYDFYIKQLKLIWYDLLIGEEHA